MNLEFVICGGGLQGCLLALAIQHYSPRTNVVLIEKSDRLCGNHTWSFHESDVPERAHAWFSQLVDFSWPSYLVRLGEFERESPIGYGSIRSSSLASRVTEIAANSNGNFQIIQDEVDRIQKDIVWLKSGAVFHCGVALDCRGVKSDAFSIGKCGFQKFFGFEIELKSDWIEKPILMDSRVDQTDGFHFIYTLPFSSRRILVEDTRFSNSPDLKRDDCLATVNRYLKQNGVASHDIVREETGCLPMPFGKATKSSPLSLGYRGNLFHAATGYSLPIAAFLADEIAANSATEALGIISKFKRINRFRFAFTRWLNRMLFCLIKPSARQNIFRRFYENLSPQQIQRFYAHKFNLMDGLAFFAGVPPSGLTPFRFLKSFGRSQCFIKAT
ncbi:MAG: lycopene beta-cyclase CrtY [Planctomycetota bacterium]|nr:lycopene beta-cyclase CrtY [Planctomycetota bacterium]